MLEGYETLLQCGSNILSAAFLSESEKPVVLSHKNKNRTLSLFVCFLFCFVAPMSKILFYG